MFDFIHCDLWGPFLVFTLDGSKLFLTISDDFSKPTWVCLLPNKVQTRPYAQSFFNLVETQFQYKMKKIKMDNEIEFYMP